MSSSDYGTLTSDAGDGSVQQRQSDDFTVLWVPANPQEIAVRYRPYLKSLAVVEFPEILQSRVDDSDLVQNSLMKACQALPTFRGNSEGEFKSWLVQIMRNELKDLVRHHGRQQRDVQNEINAELSGFPSPDASPSDRIKRNETHEWLWKVVEGLPEDYRAVILLRQQQDLSFVEIADRMEKTPDAVRMLWGRAVVALGEQLQELDASV
jgi:RNA polymerase sigma-70 factor (ECF subfamily)